MERKERAQPNVVPRTESFTDRLSARYIGKDQQLKVLLDDLSSSKAWHVLGAINGYHPYEAHGKLYHPESEGIERRKWARETFADEELMELFDITVDQITDPSEHFPPGILKGHHSLIKHVIEQPDGAFNEFLTTDFRRTFINGALWEGVAGNLEPGEFKHILETYGAELDPTFIEQGLEIADRRRKIYPHSTYGTADGLRDYMELNSTSVQIYGSFLKKLYSLVQRPNLTKDVMHMIVSPYLSNILSADQDGIPRFRETAAKLIRNPFVQEYLQCKQGEKCIAEELEGFLDSYPDDQDFAKEIILECPSPTSIINKIITAKKGNRFKEVLEHKVVFAQSETASCV